MAKVEKQSRKKKKKGRPSLLDLQKRSLRLQNPNPNPNPNSTPNPYARPPLPSSARRSTRRNPRPNGEFDDGDADEEEDVPNAKRREKELRFVLRADSAHSGSGSASASAAASRRKRKIPGDGDRDEVERPNSLKATGSHQGELTDWGPTTPLPDKKLLVFILDRLQKKDPYGVFSEPVDPEELPDYHEIIEHPMDFGTIRKKLSDGAYVNLEQFEKDVFLISSNAMHYNAPDTIYYRQARSIQEFAMKSFENLREKGDNKEPETKTLSRRGRPPKKTKQTACRPSDRSSSEFNGDATLANAGDSNQFSNLNRDVFKKGLAVDNHIDRDKSRGPPYSLRGTETFGWLSEQKRSKIEEYLGSRLRGISTNFGKKPSVADESRRNTYKQSQLSACANELPVLTDSGWEKEQLVPVWLHIKYSYARSLARFAANLGPVGLAIAEKRIEQLLPPTRISSTYFGCRSSQLKTSPCTRLSSQRQVPPSCENIIKEGHFHRTPEAPKVPKYENGATTSRLSADSIRIKEPFHLNDSNSLSHFNTVRPASSPAPFIRKNHMQRQVIERATKTTGHSDTSSSTKSFADTSREVMRDFSVQEKSDSVSADLNAGLRSPGSSGSDIVAETRQPDLDLQL